MDDAMVLADVNGIIQLWSTGAERMFGHPASKAVGETLDLIIPVEYRDAHWNGFRRAVASGQTPAEGADLSFPAQHATGEVIERRGRLTLVRRPQTNVVAVVMVFE
jgi:PAS domain S-box-containing protein